MPVRDHSPGGVERCTLPPEWGVSLTVKPPATRGQFIGVPALAEREDTRRSPRARMQKRRDRGADLTDVEAL